MLLLLLGRRHRLRRHHRVSSSCYPPTTVSVANVAVAAPSRPYFCRVLRNYDDHDPLSPTETVVVTIEKKIELMMIATHVRGSHVVDRHGCVLDGREL
jgi:hypothetical protein